MTIDLDEIQRDLEDGWLDDTIVGPLIALARKGQQYERALREIETLPATEHSAFAALVRRKAREALEKGGGE